MRLKYKPDQITPPIHSMHVTVCRVDSTYIPLLENLYNQLSIWKLIGANAHHCPQKEWMRKNEESQIGNAH